MKKACFTLVALITLLVVTLAATQSAHAATQYATNAKYEGTVISITQEATRCIRADDYRGPITILSINSADGTAVVTASMGESATQIVLLKKLIHNRITWACTGGSGGGALSEAALKRAGVPERLHRALLSGKGATRLLRHPILITPKPKNNIYDPQ